MKVRMTIAACMLLAVFGACAKGSDVNATTPEPPLTAGPTASAAVASSTSVSASPELPDGRSFGFIRSVDASNRTISFDLAQFLEGDAADKAYREDNHLSGNEQVENDYYIRNQNPKLRTLHLSDAVVIKVVGNPPDTVVGTFDDFVAGFASKDIAPFSDKGEPTYRGSHVPYWLNVAKGDVVQVEEQYVP